MVILILSLMGSGVPISSIIDIKLVPYWYVYYIFLGGWGGIM